MGNRYPVLIALDHAIGQLAICVVRFYQIFVSRFMGRTCLFSPSCSRYAIKVFRRVGFLTGMALVRRQLSRCHGDYSMRFDANGTIELITSSGKIARHHGINPAITSRISSFIINS